MISEASTRREKLGISQDEGRVFRPEPDAVGERVSHPHLAGNARNIIEVAFRIGLIQIQSRRDEAFVHRKENCADSGRSAGALRMANHRFRFANGRASTPGRSFHDSVKSRIRQKPARIPGASGASTPPVITISALPWMTASQA